MDNIAKLRPLYLAKILFEKTDEDHFLTTAQLIQILEEQYGITSHRQTIKTDIELLQQFGLEIEEVKSVQNRYNLLQIFLGDSLSGCNILYLDTLTGIVQCQVQHDSDRISAFCRYLHTLNLP